MNHVISKAYHYLLATKILSISHVGPFVPFYENSCDNLFDYRPQCPGNHQSTKSTWVLGLILPTHNKPDPNSKKVLTKPRENDHFSPVDLTIVNNEKTFPTRVLDLTNPCHSVDGGFQISHWSTTKPRGTM